MVPAAPVSISDGTHSRMLFADDNTLWVGSQQCANGERPASLSTGNTDQAANYNCLTRVLLDGTTTPTATIVPAVNQNVSATPVPYPNTDQNQYYYGSLTGICWVQIPQGLHRIRRTDPRLQYRRRLRDQQREHHHPGHGPRRRLHGRARRTRPTSGEAVGQDSYRDQGNRALELSSGEPESRSC